MIVTGCDIHIRLEYLEEDNTYESLDFYEITNDRDYLTYYPKSYPFIPIPIYNDRDYELFGLLAGVRSREYEPIDYPRGIPEDCNKYIMSEYEAGCADWHSASCFTLGELRRTYNRHRDEPTLVDGRVNVYLRLLEGIILPIEKRVCNKFWIYELDVDKRTERCKKYWDKVRMVFWFDN